MLRIDQSEYTAEGQRDSLQLHISDHTGPGSRLRWSFKAIYQVAGEPLDHSDFTGRRTLRIDTSYFPCEISHWHELDGQSYETPDGPLDFFTCPRIFIRDLADVTHSILSCEFFEIRLSSRRDYHFTLELRGTYVSQRRRVRHLFGSAGDDPTEPDDPDLSIYVVEEIPLADIHICVPRNAQEPLRYAQNRAISLATLDELVPWPGRLPDFAPRWGPSDAAPSDSLDLDFVTPWARQ